MKIAITGSEGFIGKHLSSWFSENNEVLEIDFRSEKGNPIDLLSRISRGDVFDVVLHFGANSNAQEKNHEKNYFENLGYTNALVSLCAVKNIPLIFASSAAIYGNTNQVELSPYANSKLKGEEFILETARYFLNWRFIILRLSNIYGPGEENKDKMMSIPTKFVLDALGNGIIEIWRIGNPASYRIAARDFLNVHDLVQIIDKIVKTSDWNVKTIDLGSGETKSLVEIANTVRSFIAARIDYVAPPATLDINHYQLHTKSNLEGLNSYTPGYSFLTLESGISELVEGYKDGKLRSCNSNHE